MQQHPQNRYAQLTRRSGSSGGMRGAGVCVSLVAAGYVLLLLSIAGVPVCAFFPGGVVSGGRLSLALKSIAPSSSQSARGETKLAVSSVVEGGSSTARSVTAKEAKRNLRRALDENDGSALAKDVAAAIEVIGLFLCLAVDMMLTCSSAVSYGGGPNFRYNVHSNYR